MAAGSVTVAALRHRPRQAVLVVVLAAVVTAAAALGPLYARAVEQSVLRNVVDRRHHRPAAPWSSPTGPTRPRRRSSWRRTLRGAVPPQFGAPIGGAEAPVRARRAGAGDPVPHPADQPGRPLRAPHASRRPLPARAAGELAGEPPDRGGRRTAPGHRGHPAVTPDGDPANGGVSRARHRGRDLRPGRRLRAVLGRARGAAPSPGRRAEDQSHAGRRRRVHGVGDAGRAALAEPARPTSTSRCWPTGSTCDDVPDRAAATAAVDARAAHRRRVGGDQRSASSLDSTSEQRSRPAASSRCSPCSSPCSASWCWRSSAPPPPSSGGPRSRWPGCAATAAAAPPSMLLRELGRAGARRRRARHRARLADRRGQRPAVAGSRG